MKKHYQQRHGGAAAEAAICLPLVLLIISAAIELSTAIFLKESLTVAAYEGVRVAIQREANDQDVRVRVAEVLNERGVSLGDATINQAVTINPSADLANIMDPISVRVVAPVEGNVVTPFSFVRYIGFSEMAVDVVMRKEFTLEN